MQTDLEWIEAYLAGTLSTEERSSFEAKVAQNPALSKLLAQEATIFAATHQTGKEALKQQLTAELTASLSQKPKPIRRIHPLWYAAAAAVVLLVLSIWLLPGTASTSSDLFAEMYRPPSPMSLRQSNSDQGWNETMNVYGKGDYPTALAQLESMAADSLLRDRPARYLFLGICQMELGQYEAARVAFGQISPTSLYGPHSDWYTALAWLQEEKLEAARPLLQKIAADPGHFQTESAAKLLATPLFEEVAP